MYNNIEKKIKGLAGLLCVMGVLGSMLLGIILIANDSVILGFVLLFVGLPFSLISTWLIYGFGELIEKVCEIATNTRILRNMSTKSDNQELQEHIQNSEKIATTFKSAVIMDIPQRNK